MNITTIILIIGWFFVILGWLFKAIEDFTDIKSKFWKPASITSFFIAIFLFVTNLFLLSL